jgi:sorting nexin-1/2
MKHRKAEIAQERGGLIASIGQSIAGPRFHESDEVPFQLLVCEIMNDF